jgi:S1-C subfamily serine protease
LLKVDRATTKAPSIRASIRVGEPVAAFGFPLSSMLASSGNFTLGDVTALAGIGDDTRYLQISAPVQPGSSGGPLLDERGNLVGVVTSKLNALKTAALTGDFPQNVNFAIKASALTAFLGSNSTDLADEAVSISVMVRCH